MLARPRPTLSRTGERSPLPPRVTFLDLPQHVRDQIYEEVGYGGNKFIDLNLWSISELYYRGSYDSNPSFSAPLLWAGSHLIHDEVESKLYAENIFAVSLIGDRGLQSLEMMSDTALRELRTLIVSLLPCRYRSEAAFFREHIGSLDHFGSLDQQKEDLASFWLGVDCKLSPHGPHPRFSDISLADKSILVQWKRICARLAANSPPHQLSLSLVADVDDVETAKAILDPLNGMPPLRDVAVNLGHRLKRIKGFDSRSFIRNAAKGLLGENENMEKLPFRFMSLPLELQIQILQQTHLLAGENVHFRRDWVFRSSDLDRICNNERLHPRDGEGRLSAMAGAESFCRRRNPDAFTQHCECNSFRPDTYFKVSKEFSYIARHVFYSSNKLCFHSPPIRGMGREYGYHLTLPHFLRRIPLESLWSLRSLCFIFPICSPDYLLPDHVDWHAWVESIERLSRLADLSRLKLEVHFSGSPGPRPDGTELFEHYPYG
ncbi:unnamed protein product, partial [Clonostachys rhizophaga]